METILITGASSGIGAAAAVELTQMGHHVVATGRSEAKLASVHTDMLTVARGSDVPDPIVADLSSLAEVHRLAAAIRVRHPELSVLVNNAGVQPHHRRLSADGFELCLAVNHLAHFLLTLLLRGELEAHTGRVVTTSSSSHARGTIDFHDLQMARTWTGRTAYGRSKLANILFTRELSNRCDVAASSFHPGAVRTCINRESPFVRLVKPFEHFLLVPPEKGADTLIWLSTSSEGAAPKGVYYVGRELGQTSPAARDLELGIRLWDESCKLVGIPS